jgi:alkanesulfonate monooxygenase SsuD/methylene tetrahydromethanopterin reductase-like flavin-dependent oxidoreductase (luciferase family)
MDLRLIGRRGGGLMTDYGHDLLFGAFVTPAARDAVEVLDLAVTAERAGLDLVAFQDHPYVAEFLDTQTLLAYAAARTERLRVIADVTSLPLRPPAVLARAAASLDVLSGGRFELGLGTGASWDGIEAMGGRRLTRGQSIVALGEAIEIIRGIWDTGAPDGVRYAGNYYRVDGAARGPLPPHDIGIWVGGYGPRMLALIGAMADGWLPSIEYVRGGAAALPELNAQIDEAAVAMGRPPGAVRRLLNVMNNQLTDAPHGPFDGPPEAWVDQLAELALTHGMSGFLFGGDDASRLERIGTEIAPAVREIVARERGAA